MLQVLGLNAFQVVIHHLAPAPEAIAGAIGRNVCLFAQARHSALVGMRMYVRNSRNQYFIAFTLLIFDTRANVFDIARIVDSNLDLTRPAVGEQGRCRPNFFCHC